ncbi:alanine acetyltransferase [Paenibacillus pectinilyticus]|uniref:Alanine acetyltransferase n=1 Tax=Paenibacillus pectinilyticus TaxID=512399 RepID=A0A1C0ZT83_9BACL|nr:GNAT family protein [Paenibacillus pectinilyticus]OCT11271.1 alanine acetyltransferase [Paenibacillus pectinilyticus]
MILEIDNDLQLKTLEPKDAEALFALTSACRDYLREWLPWVDATRRSEHSIAFIQHCQTQEAANKGFNTGIWYKGEFAGCIGFHPINWTNHSVSIGYWLGQGFQGQGIMTRACERLVDYAFNEFGLNRVEIRCGDNNYRSRAIPEKLGFTKEGQIRDAEWLYDHYIDLVVFGMLKREWRRG